MTQEELDAPSPVPPLPPLRISEYASVINDEQLNEFLFDKEDEFAQLISMILAAQDAGIPFYLNDSRENLVLWSAAVQRILPSRLAKKFMFNTYIGDHESMRSPRAREEGLNFHLKFKTVRYFTCSALGHNHEGQPYEGKNVVDPVMWLLQQADSSIKAE